MRMSLRPAAVGLAGGAFFALAAENPAANEKREAEEQNHLAELPEVHPFQWSLFAVKFDLGHSSRCGIIGGEACCESPTRRRRAGSEWRRRSPRTIACRRTRPTPNCAPAEKHAEHHRGANRQAGWLDDRRHAARLSPASRGVTQIITRRSLPWRHTRQARARKMPGRFRAGIRCTRAN